MHPLIRLAFSLACWFIAFSCIHLTNRVVRDSNTQYYILGLVLSLVYRPSATSAPSACLLLQEKVFAHLGLASCLEMLPISSLLQTDIGCNLG